MEGFTLYTFLKNELLGLILLNSNVIFHLNGRLSAVLTSRCDAIDLWANRFDLLGPIEAKITDGSKKDPYEVAYFVERSVSLGGWGTLFKSCVLKESHVAYLSDKYFSPKLVSNQTGSTCLMISAQGNTFRSILLSFWSVKTTDNGHLEG